MTSGKRETKYYGHGWSPTEDRTGAAHAIHFTYDPEGNLLERRYEKLHGKPTVSTDPRAAAIMRGEVKRHDGSS